MARPTKDQQAAKRLDLSQKQMEFAVWEATPDGLRIPKTQDELAARLGVSRHTIWRWQNDPRIQDAVRFVVTQNAGAPRKISVVLDAIYDDITENKNLKYAELWLRATGVLNQFSRGNQLLEAIDDVTDGFQGMSTEELEALLVEAKRAEEMAEAALSAQRLASLGD